MLCGRVKFLLVVAYLCWDTSGASHAASVALVGALTGCATLAEAGKFAPCGIWRLASSDGGATWAVEATGDHNDPHVTENDGTTYPWGFSDSRKHAEMEAAWALSLIHISAPTRPY